jgi:hypothetical protein
LPGKCGLIFLPYSIIAKENEKSRKNCKPPDKILAAGKP